jgi:hypothetical protein
MNRKERIIDLTNEIARLSNELEQERAAYTAEARAAGMKSERFGGWIFRIQRKPAKLILEKSAVPGTFYKARIDEKAVRIFLRTHGAQTWGALRDMGFTAVAKRIRDQTADEG